MGYRDPGHPPAADRHVREPRQHRHAPCQACVAWAGWTPLEQPFQKDIVNQSTPGNTTAVPEPGALQHLAPSLGERGMDVQPPTPVALTDA